MRFSSTAQVGGKTGLRAAFTLVELLVVIGIIAVLISILLPALNRARAAGQSSVCLSNLRQVGVAFRMYANDHNDWFPAYMGRTLEEPFTRYRTMNTWPDVLMDKKYLPDIRIEKTFEGGSFVNESTVPFPNAFSCPALVPEIQTSGWGGTIYPAGVATTLWSYGVRRSDQDFRRLDGKPESWFLLDGARPPNATFGGYASKFNKIAQGIPLIADSIILTSFSPVAQVHFFETRPPTGVGLPGPYSGSGTHIDRRHNDQANVLMPDISARSMTRKELRRLRSVFGTGVYSYPTRDRGQGR
jgi:prepilin-type N-terminal cleavage/methylation domain-containing protein